MIELTYQMALKYLKEVLDGIEAGRFETPSYARPRQARYGRTADDTRSLSAASKKGTS